MTRANGGVGDAFRISKKLFAPGSVKLEKPGDYAELQGILIGGNLSRHWNSNLKRRARSPPGTSKSFTLRHTMFIPVLEVNVIA